MLHSAREIYENQEVRTALMVVFQSRKPESEVIALVEAVLYSQKGKASDKMMKVSEHRVISVDIGFVGTMPRQHGASNSPITTPIVPVFIGRHG